MNFVCNTTSLQRTPSVRAGQQHTILLYQYTADPNTKSFRDFNSTTEAIQGTRISLGGLKHASRICLSAPLSCTKMYNQAVMHIWITNGECIELFVPRCQQLSRFSSSCYSRNTRHQLKYRTTSPIYTSISMTCKNSWCSGSLVLVPLLSYAN